MEPTRRGIIDCITAGFGVVHRIPALLAVPLLVDAFLWLVPRISLGPLVASLATQLRVPMSPEALTPDALAFNEQMAQTLGQAPDMNLLGVLGWQVPTLLHLYNVQTLADGALAAIATWGGLLMGGIVLAAASILLASFYLGAIAEGVRTNAWQPSHLIPKLGYWWLHLTGYLVIVTTVVLAAAPLLLPTLAALQQANASLGALALGLGAGIVFMVEVYLFLVKPAIFLDDLGPVAALRRSFSLAQRNFWGVLGFFLLFNLIGIGVGLALTRVATIPLGIVVAFVGNAYLATGLTAALMVFYRERAVPPPTRCPSIAAFGSGGTACEE